MRIFTLTTINFNRFVASSVLFTLVLFGSVTDCFAQPSVLFTGLTNTTPSPSNSRFTLNTVGGFRQVRFQSNQTVGASTTGWAFHTGTTAGPNYSPNWRPFTANNTLSLNTFIPTTFDNGARYNATGGGVDGLLPAITSGNYYTFNVSANAAANNVMQLLETSYNPVSISSVTQSVGANGTRTINITTSGTPNASENIFVRFSTNSFASSTIVQATGSGTSWTATIPLQTTTVNFYVYTSPKTKTQIDSDVTANGELVHDMSTLNLNNNSGTNYSYGPISVTSTGGTNTSTTYSTLAAAITAINGGTIHTGTIVCSVNAGYTETAPSGGFSITATGTALNTITFQKVGTGANPTFTVAAPAGTAGNLNDAVFKIVGGDFITIDGFTMLENTSNIVTTAASNTMVEFGVALFYATATNGCQNITIRNCTIDLNRTYQNTFGIYANSTHTATNVSTSATATGLTGGNHNLTITGNIITDVNQGISIVGPTAAADNNDNVVIGGSAGNANSITNFGTTATFSSYINVSGTVNGILVRNTKNYTISNNTITSSNGGHTVGANIRGIFIPSFTSAPTGTITNNINNNNISVRSALATATLSGIIAESTTGNATTTLNINANDFNTFGHTVAGSGAINFINNSMANLNTSISNNTFTNISVNTTGSVTFISDDVTSPANGTKNVNGNTIVTAFNKTGAGGTLTLYTSGASATSPSTATINNNNNNFSNITVTGATTIAGWYNEDGVTTAPAPTKNFNNNTFSNWTGGTGTVRAALIGFSSVTEISNNVISNISGSNTITGLQLTAFNKNCYNNEIRDLTTTGVFNVSGMVISAGGNHNVYRNKIYNLNANNAGATAFGLSVTSTAASTNVDFYNNLIGKLSSSTGSGTDVLRGISITSTGATSTNNIFHNTIFLDATSSGANFGTSGIFHTTSATATTSTLNLRNNIIINNSTPAGTGRTVAYRRSSTTLTNYASTSDNNLFYAGTPGVNNVIFSDGTNNDQTLTDFKTRMSTRDQASQTENTTFQSTTGSNANFLRIAAGVTSFAESGAVLITTPNINTDYWGITRPFPSPTNGGTAPDMGASEFDGIPALVPCTTPANQATVFTSGTQTATSIAGSFTAASSNPIGYLVVRSSGALSATPVDGTNYAAGATLGNGTVIQSSNSLSYSVTGLTSNTAYTITIFSFNGGSCSGGTKYLTTSPLTGVLTTCAAAPTTPTVTAITGTTASINWTASVAGGGAGTISYSVEVYTDAGFTSPISGSPFSAGTAVTQPLTGLSGSTTYFYRVKATNTFCDSAFITGNFTTNQVPTTLPYSDNLNTNNFTFINGAQTNKWSYGSAVGNPANAIYISSDNGVTNNYNNVAGSVVQAYREIIIPSGTITGTLSFDWRGTGETCCDYLRVWLVPVTFTPTAGTQTVTGSGNIQVGGNFNMQAAWTTYTNSSVNLSSFAGTTMRLVFEWRNDNSAGSSPAAAVDNISLILPAPITITPSGSTTFCVGGSVNLTASSSNTNYVYTWSPATGLNTTSGATVIANPTSTTTYTVTGVDGAQSAAQTITITVNTTPSNIVVTPATATICKNAIQTLTASGGIITDATTTVNSGTVNLSIPDNSLTTGASQNLVVSGIPASATIARVDVLLNITHTFDADLRINLEGPNGQIVNLINQRGSTGDNFTNTIATSNTSAASFSTGSAPFTGTFRADLANQATIATTPAVSTTTFSDLFSIPNGTWRVLVYDDTGNDFGTLVNCSLTLTYNVSNIITWSQSPTTPNTLFTDAAGTLAYDGVSFTNTIYAKPSASTTYTASATIGSCTKTATSVITIESTTSTDGGLTWSNGTPSATKAIIFDGSTGTIGTDISGCSLRLTNNASVTLNSGFDVTLSGAITVDSGSTFTLNNNANVLQSGTTNTNSGNITVKRNSSALIRQDYTLWSSPVTGQGLYAFSPFTFGNRFYSYNTNTNFYSNSVGFSLTGLDPNGVNGTDSNNVQFATAKGYLIRMPWNHPTAATVWNGQFTGVPNNGDITYTMTNGGAGQRFNLVGNPYPSPISMTQFVSDNSTKITGTLYFWRETNNNTSNNAYCTWAGGTFTSNGEAQIFNPNGIIRTGQGFFVEASGAATTLDFKNGQRSSDNANQFFRTTNTVTDEVTEANRFWLNLTNASGAFSQMAAGYMTNATNGVDLYDGKNINTGDVLLNSIIENIDYTIQGKALPFNPADVIPLSYKITTAGNYTITIDHVDGLFTGGAQAIYLKDNLTGTAHNLQTGAYNFASAAGTFSNRFEIVFQTQLGVDNPTFTENSVIVYSQGNDFVVNTGTTMMSSVKVFDIRGRLLQEKKGINASQTTMGSGLANQVLLVQITSEDGVMVTKKVIR